MADVIRFVCPACGQKYCAPTRLAGRHRICVKCAAPFDIPSPEVAVHAPQHASVGAASPSIDSQPTERIPPAGPISQYAAALSESHAAVETEPDASHLAAAPESRNVRNNPCLFCGEEVPPAAVKCPRCGELLTARDSKPVETPPQPPTDSRAVAEALAKAELAAADVRNRAEQAAVDARAKAEEVAAVARRNEERIAAINRQIEMQAESDYRQVLLRAADSLAAAERSAISQCRFYADVYHAVERSGFDPVAAMQNCTRHKHGGNNANAPETLAVITTVMNLICNPPLRFSRAYEKVVEAFAAYAQIDALWQTPPTDMAAREASLADLHNKFTAAMTEMRGLIRTSGM
ncbi:MAG TPA: hypothetical protein VLH60_04655 [Sedimentisphaerales bacterium]|nr:hypothetical protein [Sedimentisphaerales bacterium]